MMRSSLFALSMIASLMLPASAQATVLKSLEFNVDSVLPSAEPDIGLFTFGESVPESNAFSVSGGVLQQRTLSAGVNYSYGFPNTDVTGGGLVPGVPFVIEARLRIIDIQGSSAVTPGAFFQALDGVSRYSVFFGTDGVTLLTSAGLVTLAVDLFAFHTYRVEGSGIAGGFTLFVDGAFAFTGTGAAHAANNGFNFGDGGDLSRGGQNGADVDWDFIRVAQPIPTIAEPGTMPLLLVVIGLGMLLMAQRRDVRS